MSIQLLTIDDDPLILKYTSKCLSTFGRVFQASSLEQAQLILQEQDIDLALIDLNLSDKNQLEGLEIIKSCERLGVTPVVLTSHASPDVIGAAFNQGCHHYFTKDRLDEHLAGELGNIITSLTKKINKTFFTSHYVTQNKELQSQIQNLLNIISHKEQRILLTGPTGVGKTHLAKLLHENSARSEKAFVAKNLNEISPTLIESELFGHLKGSFTGATQNKVGLLKKAHGGTLFLDEIGTLPLSLQHKLLKVIDEKKFTPVGSNQEEQVDFQLITATCDDLEQKINSGDFRLDLYFRIKGLELAIPPLYQRNNDVDAYLQHFISKSSKKIAFSPDALGMLKSYQWPGNTRELHSVLENLTASSKGLITPAMLPAFLNDENKNDNQDKEQELLSPRMKSIMQEHGLPELIRRIELEAFARAHEKHGDKVNQLASELKISKSVFYRLSKDFSQQQKDLV